MDPVFPERHLQPVLRGYTGRSASEVPGNPVMGPSPIIRRQKLYRVPK